jgi:hypothetical protein
VQRAIREDDDEENGDVDPDMALAMGFSGFGSGR